MSNFYCRLPPVANICRARWLAGWSWSTWLFFGARWLVRAGCPNSLRAWTSFSPADSPWHDDLYCHESKIGKSLAPEQFRWQIYNSYSKAGKLVGANRKGGKYLNIPPIGVKNFACSILKKNVLGRRPVMAIQILRRVSFADAVRSNPLLGCQLRPLRHSTS